MHGIMCSIEIACTIIVHKQFAVIENKLKFFFFFIDLPLIQFSRRDECEVIFSRGLQSRAVYKQRSPFSAQSKISYFKQRLIKIARQGK